MQVFGTDVPIADNPTTDNSCNVQLYVNITLIVIVRNNLKQVWDKSYCVPTTPTLNVADPGVD